MIDVKKLITGFLILATAATFSGIIFSVIGSTSPAIAPSTAQVTIGGTATPSSNGNAFLPSEPTQAALAAMANPASSTLISTSSNPNNLTDLLATAFVNGVVSANPNGLTTTGGGNPTIVSPNVNAVAASLATASATENLQIPNWDIEAASIPITVMATSTRAQVIQYGTAVDDILNSNISAQVQSILNGGTTGATASDLAYVESQIQSTLKDTAALQTPSAMVGFQKGLIKTLVYDKDMLQLMDLAQTDPVKASLIFQGENAKFGAVQQNLLNQAQALVNKNVSFNQTRQKPQNMLLSFVDNAFGIPIAHAQLVVSDPALLSNAVANQYETISKQIEAILKNVLLQILKNTLMAFVQQKVLAWVNGNGAPLFIQNWGNVLVNSYEQSAINAINNAMSCGIYPEFIPQIQVTLGAFYTPAGNEYCADEFAAALGGNTFQQFYSNFSNGGFLAFGASTLPSGNPYGGLFFSAQEVGLTAQNTQQATLAKNSVAGGFKGSQTCDDGSDPNAGYHILCENPDGPNYTIGTNETCGQGDTPVKYANAGVTCNDGSQPIVTSPGSVTGFSLSKAVGGTTQLIAAANDITGILTAVVGSLLNSIASAAVNAAGQAVNQGLASLPTPTAGNTAPPASTPLSCNPASQTVPAASAGTSPIAGTTNAPTSTYPITVSASGGTADSSGNFPTYNWTDSNGITGTGGTFSDSFPNAGSYTITLTDSANDTPATCKVIVQ